MKPYRNIHFAHTDLSGIAFFEEAFYHGLRAAKEVAWRLMDATFSKPNYWLFSREIDLTVFFGSAVLSLLLLAVGWQAGVLNGDSPEWTWISAVLLIDVAHVWSTSFRVYFDKAEFKRRFWLYLLVPVFGYAIGVALYSEGELAFLESLGGRRRVSFCPPAIRLGRALPAKA